MKILLMQPWISYRGAETVSVQQAYYLQQLGHTAEIVAIYIDWQRLPQHGGEVSYLLPPKIVQTLCQRSPIVLFTLGPLCLLFVVLRHVRSFDVLNPHNLPSVWIAAIVGKLFHKPIVWTAHTVPERVSWKRKKSLFDYLVWLFGASIIDTIAVRMVNLILTPSFRLKDAIAKRYEKNAIVLHNAVAETSASDKHLPKHVMQLRKERSVLLLHVGNLHSQKGQLITLGVLKKLQNAGIKAGAIFVGDGPDRKLLEEKVLKERLSDAVFFAGYLAQDKIGNYYEIADINVLPSVAETFPATPLEALSHGKVSIVSHDSGMKELLSDYVLFAHPTVQDFYEKMQIFLPNKKLYSQKGKHGKMFIAKFFSWEQYCKTFIAETQKLFDKEVPATVYDKAYFGIHHEYPVAALLKERETRLKQALSFARIQKGTKVLDLGSGNGELSLLLAEKGATVWGIDYSADAVALAQEKRKHLPKALSGNMHFAVMDAKELSFADNFFDVIICLDVFEHIYPKPLEQVMQEMTRVTKNGGMLIIETAPNKFFWEPIAATAKKLFGWKDFESEAYHINVYDYFRFKKTLTHFPGTAKVMLRNDGHWYFSSRMAHTKTSFGKALRIVAACLDFLHENVVAEFIILHSPLQLFLAHDLWGIVRIKKRN